MESTGKAGEVARVFDLGRLLERLGEVPDPRHPKGLRYALAPLLVLVVLAKLAGEDHPSGIAEWIRLRGRSLRSALGVKWARMPHHNTYRRVLEEVIDPAELERVVSQHLQSLPGVGHSVLIAIDGKTVRGTIRPDRQRGEHLLAAYLPAEGIVLLQVAAGQKENEISVAPTLLAALDLRGKVVAGDAMHTQRALSVQILAGDGDYLWLVKDNQPTLHAEIAHLFTADDRTVLGGQLDHDFATERQVERGHGRRETRTITVSSELQGYSDWPGLAQVFQLERERVHLASGKVEREIVYGLTSLSAAEAAPRRLLALIRAYWGIENGLHYRRDVTFHEDRTRLTRGHAGRVMACLNNLVIGLLRHAGATNLPRARRWCDAVFTCSLAPFPARSIT